jgi:DNA-binding transcriptional LysR family regulator
MDWELWRTFLAVVRAGSLSAAARDLGTTQPTVGRQIAALEEALGLPLFTRSPSGLRPTPAAEALAPHAEAMAASAEALLRAAAAEQDEEGGVVRISASRVMGVHVLPAILADLRAARPRLALELELSNRNTDLLRRDADVAVRMVRPAQEALLARRVGEIPLGLYAHRRYLDAHPGARGLGDYDLVGPDRDLAPYAGLSLGGAPITRERFSFRTDDDLAQIAAVRAGLGVGVIQRPLAARDPDLVGLAPEVTFTLEVWVVAHEDLAGSRRVRWVFDHLVDGLRAYTGQ